MTDPIPQGSPLDGPTISSLDELFSRDPLELSDQDIDTIVARLRAQRAQFALSEKDPKAHKKPKTISLSDLNIEL